MRKFPLKIWPPLALLLFMPMCAIAQSSLAVKKDAEYFVELAFLPSEDDRVSARLLRDFSSEQRNRLDEAEEYRIAAECGMNEDDSELQRDVAGSLLTFAIGQVTEFILDRVEKRLDEKLATYSAQYSNTPVDLMFYSKAPAGGIVDLSKSCLRLTRYWKNGNEKDIRLDLIARYRADSHSIVFEPLRLFVEDTIAASEDENNERVTLAFNLNVSSVWADSNRGHRASVIDQMLLHQVVWIDENKRTTKIGESGEPVIYYFDKSNNQVTTDKEVRVPLIPWSTTANLANPNGFASVTLTTTETGIAPDSVRLLANYFNDNTDKPSEQLREALTGIAE